MPKITKRTKDSNLYKAILQLHTEEDCRQFLEELCSPAELSAMEQRFTVAELLLQDMVYVDILQKTNASTSTISRVKRVLVDEEGMLQQVIEGMQKAAKAE